MGIAAPIHYLTGHSSAGYNLLYAPTVEIIDDRLPIYIFILSRLPAANYDKLLVS
jgi:hypothetical protein